MNAGMETAAAPATRTPREVVSRTKIWEGGIIEILVPLTAKHFQPEVSGQKLNYIQFGQFFQGGAANFFVHADNPEGYTGKKVVARMELWEKVMEGGQKYLYIDLYPIAGGTPTHKLRVVAGQCPDRYKSGTAHTVFDAPEPSVGAIVLMALKKTT